MTAHTSATSPRCRDEGLATVLVLASVALIGASGIVVSSIAGAVILRHRAAVAADAAALAAAARVAADVGSVCAAARDVAARDGAVLTRCRIAGSTVVVTVDVDPPHWAAWIGPVRLNARAGPAEDI